MTETVTSTEEAATATTSQSSTTPKVEAAAGAAKLSYEQLDEYHERAIADNVKLRKANSDYKAQMKELNEQASKAAALEESIPKIEQQARERVAKAEFRARLRNEGIDNANALKLLDLSIVKYDDEGDVANADEVWDQFREANPFIFGSKQAVNTSTSSVHKAPEPKITEIDWLKVSAEERKRASKPSRL
jgi:hypothetical protein